MLDQLTILATAMILALLATAVISDSRTHRIPNWVGGGIFLLGLTAQCVINGWAGLASGVMGCLVALFFLLPFYARGAMGAGDVKLMAGAGAWLGPTGAALGCAVALVAGLALAVAALVCRATPGRLPMLQAAIEWIPTRLRGALAVERDGQIKVPYAVAIATGAVVSAWHLDYLLPVSGLMHQ